MQTAFARISHRAGAGRIVNILSVFTHSVTDIRVRHHADAHATPFGHPELHGYVIETGVFGILLQRAVTEIRVLQRDCPVEDEGQRIDRRVGSRVGIIHLCPAAQAIGHSAHCPAVTRPLVCQMPEAIPRIWRICIVLGYRRSAKQAEQKHQECQFISYHYYISKFGLILSTLKICLQR